MIFVNEIKCYVKLKQSLEMNTKVLKRLLFELEKDYRRFKVEKVISFIKYLNKGENYMHCKLFSIS